MKRTSLGSVAVLFGAALIFTPIGRMAAQQTQLNPPHAGSPNPHPAIELRRPISPPKPWRKCRPPPPPIGRSFGIRSQEQEARLHRPNNPRRAYRPPPCSTKKECSARTPMASSCSTHPSSSSATSRATPSSTQTASPSSKLKTISATTRTARSSTPQKRSRPKWSAVSISRGTLTVDGMTGKAALNYEIKDLKYVYFYVPGIGTTVVSNEPFPGAVEQKHAFDDKTLTVTVNEHTLQLSSDKRILGKAPESAFVLVDKNFTVPTKFPVMGYGPIRVAPYAWPGSRDNAELKGVVEPPPLPTNLRPALLLQPCPAGQMRKTSQPVLPGQTAPPPPCVPIPQGQATTTTQISRPRPRRTRNHNSKPRRTYPPEPQNDSSLRRSRRLIRLPGIECCAKPIHHDVARI